MKVTKMGKKGMQGRKRARKGRKGNDKKEGEMYGVLREFLRWGNGRKGFWMNGFLFYLKD